MSVEADKIKRVEKKAKLKEKTELESRAKVHGFVHGDDWKIIREKLVEKVAEVNSIVDLEDKECDRQTTLAIKKAVTIVLGWLAEIEGDARGYAIEMATLPKRTKNQVMINLDDKED